MLGLMDPAILESWVPSSHLPAPRPPELDDHYRPGEVLKFLKIDSLDFLWHFPGGGEREVSCQETGNPGQWGLRE